MDYNNIPYKSFCWCLGTTSYRTKKFNKSIEAQLSLINRFWAEPEYQDASWDTGTQESYYYFLRANGFLVGDAPRPDKDAREKTSGLVDLGLLTPNRKLTDVGRKLEEISRTNNFKSDNIFLLEADSYIYLKQLLKIHCEVDKYTIRPFIVLLYLLSQQQLGGYLTQEEFTYLVPLCINKTSTEEVLQHIVAIRERKKTVEDAIAEILLEMDNYQEAKQLLLSNPVSKELICTIGMNRKSRIYDTAYYPVYQDLYKLFILHDTTHIGKTLKDISKLKLHTLWMQYLFDTSNKNAITNNTAHHLNNNKLRRCKTDKGFKTAFFEVMHILKAKATLHDYFDLNRRYLSTADVLLFNDDKIMLDVIPKQYFAKCIDELYESAYTVSQQLFFDCDLQQISPALKVTEDEIVKRINDEYHTDLHDISAATDFVERQRYERFNHLIDKQFTDIALLQILHHIENREDEDVNELVTDNADIPTIFEYILGIVWYKISGRKGQILKYMRLSLDTNLLPKTHAGGGEADIVYEYDATVDYPQHTMLLEATLADNTNQRRMEMEPVSRHLGEHILKTHNHNSYALFVTNFLHPNVISDFRKRKQSIYYSSDATQSVNGLKIIPVTTRIICSIIQNNKQYTQLYEDFENAHQDTQYESDPLSWWKECIEKVME